MRVPPARTIVLISVLGAGAWRCTADVAPGQPDAAIATTDAATQTDAGQPDAQLSTACSPPLNLGPADGWVVADGYFTFVATGGTGDYTFEIVENGSGGVIHDRTGRYLAGPTGGTLDTIRLTDEGCDGEAITALHVFESKFEIVPNAIEAAPRAQWRFRTIGGSGQASLLLVSSESGATLHEDGTYLAGPNQGTDVIRATDGNSGDTGDAIVRVMNGAHLDVSLDTVFVPVGDRFELPIRGGSGHYRVQNPVSQAELTNGAIVGVASGRFHLIIEDQFTSQTAALTVNVVPSQSFVPERVGDAMHASTVLSPGDLNGDGFNDVVLAHPEADIDAYNGGAVFVYAGRGDGVETEPVQTISGAGLSDELGRAIDIADFDGDGQLDLIVASPRREVGTAFDVGVVEIYRGVAGGFFENTPYETVTGLYAGDLFGWSVAACDFDDDGVMDLAVGGFNVEDRERTPVESNQGGVFIFRGRPSGLDEDADRVLWGERPDGMGGWIGDRDMHLGTGLSAADFDGDGVCDLAVATYEHDRAEANTNDGLVYIYKGVRAEGLLRRPALGWASTDPTDDGGLFAGRIASGDLDGDGLADLAVGHYLHDEGSGDNHGAVYVFRGRPMSRAPLTSLETPIAADWFYLHDGPYDMFGFYPVIAEATGDSQLDLLVGSLTDELPGGPGDAGTITIYAGRGSQRRLPADEPTQIVGGFNAGDRIGTAFGVLGDIDGDTVPDLFALAGLADDYGRDVGVPQVITRGAEPTYTNLALPGAPSGMQFGFAADIVGDINADGFPDLVVGAPVATSPERGLRTGRVHIYLGHASGFDRMPTLTLDAFNRQSAYDYVGWAVSRAGDFDGDGIDDFAVLARYEDKSANSGYDVAEYEVEATCPAGAQNNTGAVFIFRGRTGPLPNSEPAFAIYGPDANDTIESVIGGFDYDGDGVDDIAFSGVSWDQTGAANSGGFALYRGRASDPAARTIVVCTPDFVLRGVNANDNLGRSLVNLGDIDNDGCDDVAAGAPLEDFDLSNQGGVRVVFGWGGVGCPSEPQMVTLLSGSRNAQAGHALGGGGHDVDGDGKPDLAVGMIGYSAFGYGEGGAALISGEFIATLPREAAQHDTNPTAIASFLDQPDDTWILPGRTPYGRFGDAVALMTTPGGGAVLVGSPYGNVGGKNDAGGAQLYRYVIDDASLRLTGAFGGEARHPGGRIGAMVIGASPDIPIGLVGGPYGDGAGRDSGALYIMDFR